MEQRQQNMKKMKDVNKILECEFYFLIILVMEFLYFIMVKIPAF